MSIQTFGADDGTNGIVTRLQAVLGMAQIRVTLPQDIWINTRTWWMIPWDGSDVNSYPGKLRAGLLAHSDSKVLPDSKRPEYLNRMFAHCRFQILVTVTHGALTSKFKITEPVHTFELPLDPESNEIRITYEVVYPTAYHLLSGYVGFNYMNPVFTVGAADQLLDWKQGAQQMKLVDILESSTKIKLRTLTGEGSVARLMDDIALEIPANAFVASMTDRCSSITAGKEKRLRCEYVIPNEWSPWACRVRSVFCDGWREDCANYAPLKGCEMFIAMHKFTRTNSIIEMNDNQVKWLFDQKEGLGLIPWSEWRGSWLDWLGHLGAKLSALRSGSMYYCHKFDTAPFEDNCLSCKVSFNWFFPMVLMGDKAFWRYVKPDQSLDMTYHSKEQNEIVLKSEDVCVTNVNDRGEGMGEPDNWAVHGRLLSEKTSPGLVPVYWLPESLPEGLYEVWLYCKNTLKYPFALLVQNHENFTQVNKRIAGYSESIVLEVPQQPTYGWVRLQQRRPDRVNPWLAPFQRLTFGMAPIEINKVISANQFAVGDEFAFKAIHIERAK